MLGKCNAHQLEKWNFCSRFQTFCAGEHCRFYEEEKPMTNADHIRSISDEELSVYLALVENLKNPEPVFMDTSDKWMEWLKQPFESGAER